MSLKGQLSSLLTRVPPLKGKKVLLWHSVVNDQAPVFNLRTHRQSDFARQIRFLKKRYRLVGPEEWSDAANHEQVLLITFDDGLRNNFNYAVPVLRAESVPAIFFVSTEGIRSEIPLWPDETEWLCYQLGRSVEFKGKTYQRHATLPVWVNHANERLVHQMKWHDEQTISVFLDALRSQSGQEIPTTYRVMTAGQLTELAQDPLFSIGSHSHRHLPLATMPPAEQRAELTTSLKILEETTGKRITSIAFPDGSFDINTLNICRELGMTQWFGVGDSSFPGVIPRQGLYTDARWKQQLAQVFAAS